MQIAYEYLKRGDGAAALPWAQQAVAAAPNAFPAHKALGQALLETGDVDGAIKELHARHQARAGEPGPALPARARLPARRTARGRHARARRVHAAGSPGARRQRSGAQSVGRTMRSEQDIRIDAADGSIDGSRCVLTAARRRRAGATAARQQPPQRATGVTREGVRAVLVDVVVRDKRGQPVRDLDAGRFRGDRRRRAADDRLVHAGLRGRRGLRAAGARGRRRGRGVGAAPAPPAVAGRS